MLLQLKRFSGRATHPQILLVSEGLRPSDTNRMCWFVDMLLVPPLVCFLLVPPPHFPLPLLFLLSPCATTALPLTPPPISFLLVSPLLFLLPLHLPRRGALLRPMTPSLDTVKIHARRRARIEDKKLTWHPNTHIAIRTICWQECL